MSLPKVSIVFPVYGVADVVRESLQSVLAQTYRPLQLVIVDDCTPDNSMEVIRQTIETDGDNGVEVAVERHSRNGGLSKARNTGVKRADGEYVYFLDSDDIIFPETISVLVRSAVRHNADVADGNIEVTGHHNIFQKYVDEVIEGEDVTAAFFSRIHVSGWNKLIRRDLLLDGDVWFEEGVLYEDVEWALRLCEAARRYVTIPDYTYRYVIREGSITRSSDRKKSLRRLDSYRNMLARVAEHFDSYAGKDYLPAARRWLSSKTVRVKYNLLNMELTGGEKRGFFKWAKSLPTSQGGLFGLLNALPWPLFDIVLRRPLNFIKALKQ